MIKIFTNKKIRFLLIFAIFFLSLATRFLLIPYPGYFPDINFWQEWTRSITKFGVTNAYQMRVNPEIIFPNYFPPYLYILGGIGFVYQKFFSPDFQLNTFPLIFLLKLPAIIFDLLTGLFIFWLLRNQFKLKFWLVFLILGFYLFNPGLIYNSSFWGQIDSLYSFFILISLFFASKSKFSFSWIFLTIALLFKMQSVIFFPLLFFLNLQKEKIANLAKNIGLAILTALIICSPFLVTGKIFQVIKVPFILSKSFPFLSVNAFNFWWLYYQNLPADFLSDWAKFLGLIPYFLVGLSFFSLVYFFVLKNLLKNTNQEMIYLSAVFIAFSFFMLPTRVHERYLYPLFPLLATVLDRDKRLFVLYFFLSLSYFANLAAVAPFGKSIYFFNLSVFSSWIFVLINIICFFYFLFYLFSKTSIKK